MAQLLGHQIVTHEEFEEFRNDHTQFKTAVKETSVANAELLINLANSVESQKKQIKFLKIGFVVLVLLYVGGVFALMH